MFCKKCGAQNLESAKFCKNCGESYFVGQPAIQKNLAQWGSKKITLYAIGLILIIGTAGFFIEKGRHTDGVSSTVQNLTSRARPLKTVKFDVRKVSMTDKNGFKIDLELPQLTGTYDGIMEINAYYDNLEKDSVENRTSEYFRDSQAENATDYFLKADYKEAAVIGDIISIRGDEDSSAGGVNNPMIHGDVFDLNTGKKLVLDDIFFVSRDKYLKLIYDAVTKSIKKEMSQEDPGNSRYSLNDDILSSDPGSADTARAQKLIKDFDPQDFYLTEKSLVVFYPKYTLGAGASGTFQYDIPFALIVDKLKIKATPDPAMAAISSFVCGVSQVKDSDGNVYGSVQVGDQCWMDRNLNVGLKLASASDKPSDNGKIEKWCFSNADTNCASGGGLYYWDEMMQYSNRAGGQGICPDGWNIPTKTEYGNLIHYLEDPGQAVCDVERDCSSIGTKLKLGGISGLNFPMSGARSVYGGFSDLDASTCVWTSTPEDHLAWCLSVKAESPSAAIYYDHKESGFSVRCIKD